jgi:hypothetical protein
MPLNRKHITDILDPDIEAKDFIHGSQPASQLASRMASQSARQPDKRRKVTMRIPKALDDMLTNVWHERGIARTQGTLPEGQVFEKQDIIAEALREWFEKRGYLKSQEG